MRNYVITVAMGSNRHARITKASRASVAVHRTLDKYTDSQLDGAVIYIQRGVTLDYGYRYIADIPCEPAGSTKREFVSPVMQKLEAINGLAAFTDAHPTYRFVSIIRVEVIDL